MSSYSRVVVGSDGSETAREAVAVAGKVAAGLGVPVTAVTAWKTSIEVLGARDQTWAERTTTGSDIDLTAEGVSEVEKVEVHGDAVDALLDTASGAPDSLIVVGTLGLDKASSRLLGNIPNQLAHKSSGDVLFVRKPGPIESVGLATDGSDTSIVAVTHGYQLAAALGARAALVTVADSVEEGSQVLEKAEAALQANVPDAVVEPKILTGKPADALAEETGAYDLLVIGNRGMSGIARVLGSTANSVTHNAETNLLLVNTTRN
ncbi:universal stress protein [Smaragdicoccus niigatensis]|uniref:universal stress protein n=1 Tax=Smaragdicoccus niigatensis TaxID=359359 RepID=UPI00036E00C4|nr:universal stress protein [Smaragdicoccus niigatensis]